MEFRDGPMANHPLVQQVRREMDDPADPDFDYSDMPETFPDPCADLNLDDLCMFS